MRTVGFTPPLSKTGVRSGTGTSSQINLRNQQQNKPLSKKKFYFKMGLEFVDTKSKERTWLDILCVGRWRRRLRRWGG
jgi:hypothetical protein